MSIEIFGSTSSSSTLRVILALTYKNLPFKFSAPTSSMPQVPVMRVEDVVKVRYVSQSMAIMEYLDEIFLQVPLLPLDSLARARVRELTHIIVSDVQPLQNCDVVSTMVSCCSDAADHLDPLADPNGVKRDWIARFTHKGFRKIENLLQDADMFCYGNAPTMADMALVPQVINALYYDVNLADYPNINKVYRNCINMWGDVIALHSQRYALLGDPSM